MKPTDEKDYKRRITRGFWSGLCVGSFFGGVSTVWVRPPYRTPVNPTTLTQSAKMIIRPAIILALAGSAYEGFGSWMYTIREKNDWWTYFVSGSAAGAVVGLSRGNVPDLLKMTFFVGALASVLESCRAHHGVGPTLNARIEKKSKVLPDPVPREEMQH
ncbi:uncharacterized protein [Blastocystis hominis]|uniref:Uncharacterized protein n=1 Tax=Blastocystis hominis TaxID=12968 RepID=D8M6H2_BLAHO|nr:uncharacterized protein [Blastocystis hominis]CBK23725.2 unnamed protein product [Blastocystis hominis]|eukprot:XP_012897773.1 uncharacterized protein [Blastocystis hominis]